MTEEDRNKVLQDEWDESWRSRIEENYHNPKFCEKHDIDRSAIGGLKLFRMVHESKKADWRTRSKMYYEKNAEMVQEAMQKHREEHREEILAKKKIYAQRKFTCECGCEVARINLARHLESDKHRKLTHSKPSVSSP